MKKQTLFSLTFIILLLSGCAKAQTAWITDLDAAKEEAVKSKKDLLILFTGSDWDDPSKELAANVITEEFFAKGSKSYVLCNLDIVEDETLMDKATAEVNYTTATKYGVQQLPFIVLQTSEGDVYGTTGMNGQTGTEKGLFDFLDTFQDARKSIVAMKKEISSSKGSERAVKIDAFIETIDASRREQYSDLIREIPSLDADGKAGLKGKYLLQVAYLDAIGLYQAGLLTKAGDTFIAITDSGALSGSQLQEAWYMGAYMYALSGSTDNEKLLGWLNKAVDADPLNPGAEQIKATIDKLLAPK